ncbi:hypothetical protein T09_12435 [Trichinella sp. T9]|nr:hypothetical protein T09_12435 [Trichinella sp. T9]
MRRCQPFQRCQQRGSSRYEAAIEIHTSEELAEFVHGCRLTESAYRFDFFCQRLDALAADLEPEELKVRREENAFCRHVVQVDEAESQPTSHFVHKTLECLRGISQTERHSHVFKKAERCRDGRLRNIFFRHRDLLIGADQVFGCFFGTMWSGDAQLLLDGRMMPRSSWMSNSFRASSSRSGGNRRGLAKTGGPCVRMWC